MTAANTTSLMIINTVTTISADFDKKLGMVQHICIADGIQAGNPSCVVGTSTSNDCFSLCISDSGCQCFVRTCKLVAVAFVMED